MEAYVDFLDETFINKYPSFIFNLFDQKKGKEEKKIPSEKS